MNGFDPVSPEFDTEAIGTATEEQPRHAASRVASRPIDDDLESSPDPLYPTDRYRLVMPYTDKL
jgi:hypothetical protein